MSRKQLAVSLQNTEYRAQSTDNRSTLNVQRSTKDSKLQTAALSLSRGPNSELNSSLVSRHSSLLLEIGTEEIPARFLPFGIQKLKENTESILREDYIKFSEIKTSATPRRLAMIANGIPFMQEDRVREVFGPAKKAAFDEKGNPTKAAVGFATSQGVKVESLVVKKRDRGEYVVAVIEEKGIAVKDLLPEVLKKIVLSMHFPKSMRWGNGSLRFVRPIHWVLALFDSKTITFEIDGIKSSNLTRGHRFLSPGAFQITEIPAYINLLENNYVILDHEVRKRLIIDRAKKLSAVVGGKPVEDEELLSTVTHLVEYPVPVIGSFPEEYLKLPEELLITVMKSHQKYFAVEDEDSNLINHFIVISNTREENAEAVRVGAERVIKARFEDAKFYYEDDRKRRLADRIDDLKKVTYQERLGSLYDKVKRIASIADFLGDKLIPLKKERLGRASWLSKTDLITGVVREFPELQGLMGKYYAMHDGEDKEVADALVEQYLPAYSGDRLPETEVGALLSLADKIDNIASFFSIGLTPTGSEDPFALRRQALAVIAIIIERGYSITLKEVVDKAIETLAHLKGSKEGGENILLFFEQRLEPLFLSQGYTLDAIQSIISLSRTVPLKEIKGRLDAIQRFKEDIEYNDFLIAIRRVNNIIPKTELPALNPGLLSEESEEKLYEKLNVIKSDVEGLLTEHKYYDAVRVLSSLTNAINNFFDNVLVMDDREEVKLNRLALLKGVWTTASSIADFSKLAENK